MCLGGFLEGAADFLGFDGEFGFDFSFGTGYLPVSYETIGYENGFPVYEMEEIVVTAASPSYALDAYGEFVAWQTGMPYIEAGADGLAGLGFAGAAAGINGSPGILAPAFEFVPGMAAYGATLGAWSYAVGYYGSYDLGIANELQTAIYSDYMNSYNPYSNGNPDYTPPTGYIVGTESGSQIYVPPEGWY